MPPDRHDAQSDRRRLDSWKEIAAFFGRAERTVKRWEMERSLPVHRVPGGGRGRIFAYADELAEWLRTTGPVEADAPLAGPVQPLTTPAPNASQTDRRIIWTILAVVLFATSLAVVSYERKLASVSGHTPNKDAQDLYLKGRYYWDKRTPESLRIAVDYFTQAIVKDSGYSKAYVGLADSYNLLREFAAMPDREAYSRSLAAAKRAVELEDSSAEAHASLGFAYFWGARDLKGGEKEFKRAIQLDPKYVPAHHWYATALAEAGRPQEAMREIDQAQALDPNSTSILADKGFVLYYDGRPDQAIALEKELEASAPAFLSPHSYLSMFYLWQGDLPNSLAESKQSAELSHDPNALAVSNAAAEGFAAGGRRGMLEAMLQQELKLYPQGNQTAYTIAMTYALSGNRDQALRYLQASLAKGESTVLAARMDPAWKDLHSDPGYRRLMAEIGFR
jgi:tetratricopeptide (TPR) repeat protein